MSYLNFSCGASLYPLSLHLYYNVLLGECRVEKQECEARFLGTHTFVGPHELPAPLFLRPSSAVNNAQGCHSVALLAPFGYLFNHFVWAIGCCYKQCALRNLFCLVDGPTSVADQREVVLEPYGCATINPHRHQLPSELCVGSGNLSWHHCLSHHLVEKRGVYPVAPTVPKPLL